MFFLSNLLLTQLQTFVKPQSQPSQARDNPRCINAVFPVFVFQAGPLLHVARSVRGAFLHIFAIISPLGSIQLTTIRAAPSVITPDSPHLTSTSRSYYTFHNADKIN